jgi:non-hemolytic enterotoxin B/C
MRYKTIFFCTIAIATLTTSTLPSYTFAQTKNKDVLFQNNTTDDNLLQPIGVSDVVQKVGSQIPILDGYAQFIMTQPALNFINSGIEKEVVNQIVTDQLQAQSHAKDWRNIVKPQVISTLEGIFSFSTKFDTYYNTLIQAIEKKKKATLTSGLHTYYAKKLHKMRKQQKNLLETLKNFKQKLIKDGENFHTDNTNLLSEIGDKQQFIQHLKDLIKEYQKNEETGVKMKRREYETTLWNCNSSFRRFTYFFRRSNRSSVFDCRIRLYWRSGRINKKKGTAILNNARKEIRDTEQDLSQADKQFSELAIGQERWATFTSELDPAIDGAQTLLNQWTVMGGKYDALVDKIDKVQPEDLTFVKPQLISGKKSWESIKEYAGYLKVSN